jgi:hypothetical protein
VRLIRQGTVIGDDGIANATIVETPDQAEGNSVEDYFDPNGPCSSAGDRFVVRVDELRCFSTATRIIADIGHDT